MVPPKDRISDDADDQRGGDPGLRGLIGRARHAAHPGAEQRRRGAAGERRPAELEEAEDGVEAGPEVRPGPEPHDAAVDRLAGVERVADRLEVEDDLQHDRDGGDQEDRRRVLDRRGRPDQPFAAADRGRRHDRARADHLEQVADAERRRRRQVGDVPARQLAVIGRERAAVAGVGWRGRPRPEWSSWSLLGNRAVRGSTRQSTRNRCSYSQSRVRSPAKTRTDPGGDVGGLVATATIQRSIAPLRTTHIIAPASDRDPAILPACPAALSRACSPSSPSPTLRAGADWPQFLGPTRNGVVPRRADRQLPFPPADRKWSGAKKVGQGLSGPVVVGEPRDPLPPGRRSRGRRVARRRHRRRRVAVSAIPPRIATTSASTRGRARCRSSPTGSSTRSARRDSCTPSTSRRGKPLWTDRHDAAVRRAEGILRRGRLAAGRRRPGDRQHRRRQGAASSRSTPTQAPSMWTATDDAASYSSPVGATIGGQRYADVLHPQRPGRSRSRDRRREVPAGAGGLAPTRRSTPRRRSSSTI